MARPRSGTAEGLGFWRFILTEPVSLARFNISLTLPWSYSNSWNHLVASSASLHKVFAVGLKCTYHLDGGSASSGKAYQIGPSLLLKMHPQNLMVKTQRWSGTEAKYHRVMNSQPSTRRVMPICISEMCITIPNLLLPPRKSS